MFEISRRRQVFLTCLFVFCVGGVGSGAQEGGRWLVSPELLRQAGLEIVWDDELPLKPMERLQRLFIIGERLYALSSSNYLIALDKETGKKVFSKSAAAAGLPLGEPVLYKDELMYAVGSRLVEMSEQTGEEVRVRNVESRIVCPAVRNSSFFYISGADRRLHVLREKDLVQLFEATADNDSMITSVMADEDSVILGTDAGNVVCMSPDKARRLWQFDAAGAIAGPVVRDGMSVYFASKDTNVYRVDMTDLQARRLVWKYQVAGVPETAPRVTQKAVYQYVRGKGVTAIDKQSGKLLWSLPDALELLTEAQGKVYTIAKKEKLVLMDNATGKVLHSASLRGVTKYAVNSVDSKMYIGDRRGRIMCIEPIRQR